MSSIAAMINYHGVKVFPVLLGFPYNTLFNLSGAINQRTFGQGDGKYSEQLELDWPTDEGIFINITKSLYVVMFCNHTCDCIHRRRMITESQ